MQRWCSLDLFQPSESIRPPAERVSRYFLPKALPVAPVDKTALAPWLNSTLFKDAKYHGEGTFGVVYTAVEVATKKPVVIKLFRFLRVGVRGELYQEMPQAMQEACNSMLLCNLCEHLLTPILFNVLPNREIPLPAGWLDFFIAFEPCSGKLSDRLGTKLDVQLVARFGVQLYDAVAAMHSMRILHNDIAATNVLEQGDSIKLMDFGCSVHEAVADTALPESCQCPGDAAMAPELPKRRSRQSDVFQVGIVLAYLLLGQEPPEDPLDEDNITTLLKEVAQSCETSNRALTSALIDVLTKSLAWEAAKRGEAQALADILREHQRAPSAERRTVVAQRLPANSTANFLRQAQQARSENPQNVAMYATLQAAASVQAGDHKGAESYAAELDKLPSSLTKELTTAADAVRRQIQTIQATLSLEPPAAHKVLSTQRTTNEVKKPAPSAAGTVALKSLSEKLRVFQTENADKKDKEPPSVPKAPPTSSAPSHRALPTAPLSPLPKATASARPSVPLSSPAPTVFPSSLSPAAIGVRDRF